MKTAIAAFGLAACLAYSADAASTVMTIGGCSELQAAAAATSSGNIVGELLSSDISCAEWTSVEVTDNKLKLVAGGSGSDVYTFNNIRFVVSASAVLRVDASVEFTGDDAQDAKGGLLYVEEGGKARFLGAVYMHDVAVTTSAEDTLIHGGCIYNEGYVRFEDEFSATDCNTLAVDGLMPGSGSGIWNGEQGKVIFKQAVSMSRCGTLAVNIGNSAGNEGGAIYNAGKTSFTQDATFEDNKADDGGAIHNVGTLKFLKSATYLFSGNESNGSGGHVYNAGDIIFRARGVFTEGVAGGSGGAFYNWYSGTFAFYKPVEFSYNTAGAHGGAMRIAYDVVDSLPEEATYIDNMILHRDYDFNCHDVYVNGELEDDYDCLPCEPGDVCQ